ncbi:MAG: succinylglutamate-semialdehyde dehydrogenase, partial [Gammaproteobacteria bacterium]
NNQWRPGQGVMMSTRNPATGLTNWEGNTASSNDVEQAISAARNAFPSWSQTTLQNRTQILQAYATLLQDEQAKIAESIAEETGKPLWDSKTEVTAMINKIAISVEAYQQRTGQVEKPLAGGMSVTKHKPLGVMAVLGPYNFPGHLPNGHLVPALLAGNTVVFKPSEYTPKTAILLVGLLQAAGIPAGVLNMVLGGADIGQTLTASGDVNGILFTGSYATGKKLHQQCAGHPEKLLALEMGGNNPLIAWQISDYEAAAYLVLQSAFISAGQRCTCARRLIVGNNAEGAKLLSNLQNWMQRIKTGYWTEEPEPFMGPVITATAAKAILDKQQALISQGGEALITMQHLKADTGLLSPGLIDVTAVTSLEDTEIFGPLLQVIRVNDFDTAIKVANNTHYGLVAGLLSDGADLYDTFYQQIYAGVLSWNRPTTGASSVAPFGGVGWSGNYRPGAYYTADYCAYPVASSQATALTMPSIISPGLLSKEN